MLIQAGDTTYTQDLVSPLSQVLSDGTSTYLYGHDRLATVDNSGTRTWALHDALGSVRLSLDDAGTPLVASDLAYSPFGLPQSGATPEPFGFTGELHHNDLVYLRARWYDPGSGTFTSVDPFDGFPTRPYSLHPYQYAYSAPTMWTDPSGRFVDCSAYPNHPQCSVDAYDGWHETDPEQGRRDTSITVDFIPFAGDVKGFGECIAGHDLITGDPLAWWERVLGCICLKEVATTATIGGSILGAGRHADDAADAARHADEPESVLKSSHHSFQSGHLFERAFETPEGVVDVLAEVEVEGTTLHFKDIAVYPRDVEKISPGSGAVRSAMNELAEEAASEGFEFLRITGIRYSGANPGREYDRTIDLTKR